MSRRYLKRFVFFIVIGTSAALVYFVYTTARLHAGAGWAGGVQNMHVEDNGEDYTQDSLQENIEDNVNNNVEGNLQHKVQENIRVNIQDNIRGNMRGNIHDKIQENLNEDKEHVNNDNNVIAAADGNQMQELVPNNGNEMAAVNLEETENNVREENGINANLKEQQQTDENSRGEAGHLVEGVEAENDEKLNVVSSANNSVQETYEHTENLTLPEEFIFRNDKGKIIAIKHLPFGLQGYLKNKSKMQEDINRNKLDLDKKNIENQKEHDQKFKTFDEFLKEQRQNENLVPNVGAFQGRFGNAGADNNAQNNIIPNNAQNNILPNNAQNNNIPNDGQNNIIPNNAHNNNIPNDGQNNIIPNNAQNNFVPNNGQNNIIPNNGQNDILPNNGQNNFLLNNGQNFLPNSGQNNFIPNNGQNNFIPNNGQNNFIPNNGQNNFIPNNGQNNFIPNNAQNNFIPNNGQNNILPNNGQNNFIPNNGQNNIIPNNAQNNILPNNGQNNIIPNNGQNNIIPNNGQNNFLPNNGAGNVRDNIEVKKAPNENENTDLLNKNREIGEALRNMNPFARGRENKQPNINQLNAQENANPFGQNIGILQGANQPTPAVNVNKWRNRIVEKPIDPIVDGRGTQQGFVQPNLLKADNAIEQQQQLQQQQQPQEQQPQQQQLQQQQQQQQQGERQPGFAENNAADSLQGAGQQATEDVNSTGNPQIDCLNFRFPTGVGKLCIPGGNESATAMAKIQQDAINAAEVMNQILLILSSDKSLSFIDVGAGIGGFSTAAALLVRGVLAMEPLKLNHRLLLKTATENHVGHRIKLLERALDSELFVGFAKPAVDPESYGEVKVSRIWADNITHESNTVHVTTLNKLVSDVPFRRALLRLGFHGGITDNFLDASGDFFREMEIPYIITHWPGSKKADMATKIMTTLPQLGYKPSLTWNGPEMALNALQTGTKYIVWRKV